MANIVGSIQSGGAAASSFTPTLPNSGSRSINDYVLLIVATENNNTVTCTISLSGTDSGNWTQASPAGTGSSTTKQCGLWLYWRKVDGTESAPTVTLQSDATTEYTYSCMEVTGLSLGTLIDAGNTWAALNSSAVNTNQVSPAETFNNRWILMAIGGRASSPTGTWTGPTQAINVTDALSCYQIVGTQDASANGTYQPKVVLSVNTLSTAVAWVFNLGTPSAGDIDIPQISQKPVPVKGPLDFKRLLSTTNSPPNPLLFQGAFVPPAFGLPGQRNPRLSPWLFNHDENFIGTSGTGPPAVNKSSAFFPFMRN